MLRFQILLIAVLIACFAFVSCDRAQQVLKPAVDASTPETPETTEGAGETPETPETTEGAGETPETTEGAGENT